ncbi:hypothetical protein MNV49_002023 [Pseudohyphozyma bogoriensis]|nr:hypothetical protein MNV49_002023 [Pseudohyphozyma bogoriensis]
MSGYPVRRTNTPSPPEAHSYPPANAGYHDDAPIHRSPFAARSSSAQSSTHSSMDDSSSDQKYAQGGLASPYGYGSTPSLPRYSSNHGGSSSQSYLPQPSPLNPTARPGRENSNPPSRYSSYGFASGANAAPGNGAHPLSNAMYLESSPTLGGSDVLTEEKMRMTGGQDGEYPGARGPSPTAQTAQPGAYRRGPKAKGLSAVYRGWSGANIADSGKDERHIKLPRLGYLDGTKFIAAWVVLNGTLFDAVLSSSDYSFIQRNSPLYITRSTGLGITFLLLLSGRSLITPLWDVPTPSSQPGAPKAKSALISWARLTRAMLVRPFRFILPVLAVIALQWGLGATGKTSNCNAVGMDEPYWNLISTFSGYCTLVFDVFTYYEYDTLAGQTFAGNLWTNAWFFQAGYAVYVTHLMLGNLSSNRYWVYGIMAFFSWTTYNYFFAAILGLALADMHAHGHLHRIRTKWPLYSRLGLHAVLIIVACVTQFVPVVRDNINSGLATINVQDHPELTFCDAIFAFCWMFAIETSGFAQNVLGNIVMRNLGKLSAGLYLLAPAITFTIVPNLALTMHNNGSSASSVLGLSWLVLFLVTLALSIAFHFVVELPSKMLGEVVAEILEGSTGGIKTTKNSGDGTNRLLKRNPGGGAKLAKPTTV